MNRRIIALSALLILVLFACILLWRGRHGAAVSGRSGVAPAGAAAQAAKAEGVAVVPVGGKLEMTPLVAAIVEAERAIAAGGDARTILAALREKLLAAGSSEASAAICAYLASGRDVATGLPFAVGPGGVMLSDPTMRTFLLDLLATVDPTAALAQAEIIFDAKTSADEYAICLRNVGKIDTSAEGRAYVGKRARELLADATLSASPTAGFVEAFDAIVYSGDTRSLSLLASYTDKDKGLALNLPAFMAMDRMTIDDTGAVIETLLSDSSLLDERPLTRASLLARADLADKDQTEDVESYLLKLDADSDEATYFLDLLPNLNFTLTDGLLTDRVSISGQDVQERLNAALDAVDTWLSDSRFSSYKTQLQKARTRIAEQLGK